MQLGRVLSGRYELVERLGSGGMAEVFLARDHLLERDVAVKVPLPSRAVDDDFVRRFRREARSAASLNHPNVVAIHDTGIDDTGTDDAAADGDAHYIVMALIDGPTLETVIAERAPLATDEAVDVALQVCAALEAAHAAGLVHRDIKPGNIMFDASGEVKVTDFGIALAAAETRLTANADVFGSAAYLAPEQATGDDVDGRADLYALGCVTYEMLTGRTPYTGDEPISLVYQHLHGELEPPSTHRDGIPAALDAVVVRMLARDREERYGSADEVREELERLGSGGALAAAAGGGVTVTQRLEPEDTVAMTPARASSEAAPEPEILQEGGTSERPTWRTGLLVVGALVLLAFLLAATVLRPDQAADPGPLPGTPAAEASPSPSPSPTPMSVESAVIALFDTVTQGLDRGELSEDAAEELRKLGEEALGRYRDGKLDEALAKLDEGRRKVVELAGEGEIERARADAVLTSIDQVEAAMLAQPPPEPDGGDENGGEGDDKDEDENEDKNEGKGKGKDGDGPGNGG